MYKLNIAPSPISKDISGVLKFSWDDYLVSLNYQDRLDRKQKSYPFISCAYNFIFFRKSLSYLI